MSAGDRERAVADAVPAELFIDGRWRPGSDGKPFDVEDPSTGAVLRAVADASRDDGVAALDAAVAAQ
ncbi:MAG: NAD-dependent succinate-semialdehyde dehydrogenase, partial [Pseudonocardiales bacterium]|nr:NAD-dependent succinate-semialdehyde dehydrogenase [Pseudonocardiales bacterium]